MASPAELALFFGLELELIEETIELVLTEAAFFLEVRSNLALNRLFFLLYAVLHILNLHLHAHILVNSIQCSGFRLINQCVDFLIVFLDYFLVHRLVFWRKFPQIFITQPFTACDGFFKNLQVLLMILSQ